MIKIFIKSSILVFLNTQFIFALIVLALALIKVATGNGGRHMTISPTIEIDFMSFSERRELDLSADFYLVKKL